MEKSDILDINKGVICIHDHIHCETNLRDKIIMGGVGLT